MSWGSIYGETWWGSQNASNFNEISYYIYAVDQLKRRALSDGAIMEGFGCAAESIRTMGDRDTADWIFYVYDKRVFTDGGSTEARICTIKEISLLR